MKAKETTKQRLLKKIQKRLMKVIKAYEKIIVKMEVQLERVNRLEDDEEVNTLRETIITGLNQSRLFLKKAKEDVKKVVARQAEL